MNSLVTGMRAVWVGCALCVAGAGFGSRDSLAEGANLLRDPGFEDAASQTKVLGGDWKTRPDSQQKAVLHDGEVHSGQHCVLIPKAAAVEQSVTNAKAGGYLARCWVKSEGEQNVTFVLQNPARPWAGYSYSDVKVPKGQWTQVEIFCALDMDGDLELTLGSMPQEFRTYHGALSQATAPILADDFELIRCEPTRPASVAIWDAKKDLDSAFDWTKRGEWAVVQTGGGTFAGTPVFQSRHLAGMVREDNGELAIYAIQGGGLKQRGSIAPSPAFKVAKCTLVNGDDRTGIRVTSEDGKQAYTAWISTTGLIRFEPAGVRQFVMRDCRLRYGILPSFVGSDICYSAAQMPGLQQVNIPSTQWFVGLVDGNESMMVAVWDSEAQGVSLGLSGSGAERMIDSLAINTEKGGFALSFVEHSEIWHKEPLQEDWLGEYTAIGWKRPFPARWMGNFFATPGGERSFQEPYMEYSFPVATTKTRMWGVWFEDWNHYPLAFEGDRTIVHFEKSFVPTGDALFYFLEPAGGDVYSPSEIVEQALGKEKAMALFDFDANKIRKLKYSTPDEFMYDRPVCATTTRLSQIKQSDKPTVGVNLATHLYEFIQGIRGRVDQYQTFFAAVKEDLKREKAEHAEMEAYLNELEAIITEAQSKSQRVYSTALSTVQAKTESMKQLLAAGKGDGFDCGTLDVRGPAGAQDDLCRRYNRQVLRLMQTAALKCGDSPEKAVMARKIWFQSREILRQPTRWEPRRTLYFFEP